MKKLNLKQKFSERQKKIIVAESYYSKSAPSVIAKKNKIDLATLNKWRHLYEYDRLVTSMVQNYLSGQKLPIGAEEAPEETEPVEQKMPIHKRVHRTFTDEQKTAILIEAQHTTDRVIINKYKLSDSLFYKWKKRLATTGGGSAFGSSGMSSIGEKNTGVEIGYDKPVIIIDKNEDIDESVGLKEKFKSGYIKIPNKEFIDVYTGGIPLKEYMEKIYIDSCSDNETLIDSYNSMTDKFNFNFTQFNELLINLQKDIKETKCMIAFTIFVILGAIATYCIAYFG